MNPIAFGHLSGGKKNVPAMSQAGTVVWVGPTDHPEFCDAFGYLRSTASQMAVRSDQLHLLSRPATNVQWIIFARVRRVELLPSVAPEIRSRYPNATVLVIDGSLCDGERRSGNAWKSFTTIRFNRWNEWLHDAESIKHSTESPLLCAPLTLFLFDRFIDAEPWLALARSLACPALWARRYDSLSIANVQRMVWDESVAPKSSSHKWSQVLAACDSAIGCKHHWLVTQPMTEDISYAMHAGVCEIHSKPVWDVSFLRPLVEAIPKEMD